MSETAEWPVAVEGAAWALLADERRILAEMSDFYGYPARRLADDTGLTTGRVKRAQGSLVRQGLADFGPLFDEDDGMLRGRGYWLNQHGYAVQRYIRGCQP